MGTNPNNTLEGPSRTVAQLAISHPGALAVFTKYNIDYTYDFEWQEGEITNIDYY